MKHIVLFGLDAACIAQVYEVIRTSLLQLGSETDDFDFVVKEAGSLSFTWADHASSYHLANTLTGRQKELCLMAARPASIDSWPIDFTRNRFAETLALFCLPENAVFEGWEAGSCVHDHAPYLFRFELIEYLKRISGAGLCTVVTCADLEPGHPLYEAFQIGSSGIKRIDGVRMAAVLGIGTERLQLARHLLHLPTIISTPTFIPLKSILCFN